MIAPHAFGMSTFEIWVPLLHGGTIVLAPPGNLNPADLPGLIDRHHVTCLHLTAGLFRVIAEETPSALAALTEVMTGGDTVAPTAVQRVQAACPNTTVRIMYGNTETTLFATTTALPHSWQPDADTPTVPIGTALDGMTIYLLDDQLNPVPAGTVGEMYIAGAGLARGYLDRPDLTAERFLADPYGPAGSRMFRSGDLARTDTHGQLHFAGRADHQVKIRGFRVEPAEIEATLARHPGIAHTLVTTHDDDNGDKHLIAYLVPEAGHDLDPAALRAHATAVLPDFMQPDAYITIPKLPLTPNGKLDRAALPVPTPTDLSGSDEDGGSDGDNTLQNALRAIFADVLAVPTVGSDDSFFELGGQSLQAMRMILRIETELGLKTTIAELFDAPTPALLTKLFQGAQHD
jgi:acyl-coenzyme A synthetase/AMP-(fatty) acid ligase/acyl carrier protein